MTALIRWFAYDLSVDVSKVVSGHPPKPGSGPCGVCGVCGGVHSIGRDGMSHLAAHDWDRIGQPPAPGRDYVVSVLERDILDVAKALVEADDFDEEADQLDDEANDRRRDGDKKRDSVKDRLDAIRKDNPKLAAAIEDNPRDYDSLDAARKAAA